MAEEIRRIAALLDQPLSERDHELITYVKHKFATDFKKDHSYFPEKVVTRSDTQYGLIQNGQARKNYYRRQELLSKGFFSPVNKPYKTVGRLYSDNVDLFSTWLTSEDQKSLKTQWDKKFGKNTVISSKFTQEKTKKEENIRAPPVENLNGFLQLKQYMREMVSIRRALHTGRPLIYCLRDQDKPLLLMKKPVPPKTPCDRAISADKETVPPLSMSMNQQALDPEEEENLQRIQYRKQKLFSEKLQWIYMVLCGISHMRNRDLKTLVPLNSSYVNIIMKDTEKTNILLKQSHSYNPPLNYTRQLVSLAPEDCHSISRDVWDTFISHQDTTEPSKLTTTRTTGYKALQSGPRRKVPDGDGYMPPWLLLLLDENTSLEKKTVKPGVDQSGMLERAKEHYRDVKKVLNIPMESVVFEKRKNREERMRTLFNALMASKSDAGLSSLLTSLKSGLKEPKSTTGLWFATLQSDATELSGDRDSQYNVILQKISEFQSFSNKKLPYSKEKFCLLVLSMSPNQLLRPAMQEALLFLTENVLLLLPRQLKQWYQYLKLPFPTTATAS
ncbi:uncharacterized protein LOC109909612 [Oncorhynchus kisutch]|uniref:uncharacterized protein LOC109909612 n=1 Tax=Oncorhynchus kisutch TaxID=8019 RepID=UPI0012DD7681|nr:uncharacterized protein LOC109909612 [Oncorhynchus kisutch]XP_031651100.1 uncharacterized protein LOC109909612 [Oncorhynchus kisutch]XP_031651101.1 uncharacterized protein LOC109909612 [Oncorhynchus kisutch]